MKLYFVSKNPDKIQEMKLLFQQTVYSIKPFTDKNLFEIQTKDSEQLVHDKTVKAFSIIQKPLFVEHTYLKIDAIKGFPGGLTSSFWESFEADLTCKHFSKSNATAETIISYCDMKHIYTFNGSTAGSISTSPMGDSTFQWDTVFIPDGHTKTFAEIGTAEKNKFSMRATAVKKFIEHLEKNNG